MWVVETMKFSSSVVTPFLSSSRRYLCSSGPGKNLTDKELHQRYNIFSKFKILSSLTSQTNATNYGKLATDLGFVGPPGSFWTYTDLHHPLLLKYDFDPHDFIAGARESFHTVYDIIQSQEFDDYVQGERTTDSENINYLKSISTAKGFKSFVTHQKEKSLLDIGKESIQSVGLLRVHMKVVDEVVPIVNNAEDPSIFSSLFGSPPTPGLVGFEKIPKGPSPSSEKSEEEKAEEEAAAEEKQKDHSPVPPVAHHGVWATVSCLSDVYTGPEEAKTSRRLIIYKLEGDISRRDDLEWKVSRLTYAAL